MTEEYDKRGNDSWLAMEKYGDLVGQPFACTHSFQKSTTVIINVQGVWHSPSMATTIVKARYPFYIL